jgi:hypothetical protein
MKKSLLVSILFYLISTQILRAQETAYLGNNTISIAPDSSNALLRCLSITVNVPQYETGTLQTNTKAVQVERYDTLSKKWTAIGSAIIPTPINSSGTFYYMEIGTAMVRQMGKNLVLIYQDNKPLISGNPASTTLKIRKFTDKWTPLDSIVLPEATAKLVGFEVDKNNSGHFVFVSKSKAYYGKLNLNGFDGTQTLIPAETFTELKFTLTQAGEPQVLYSAFDSNDKSFGRVKKLTAGAWIKTGEAEMFFPGGSYSPFGFDNLSNACVIKSISPYSVSLLKITGNTVSQVGPEITLPYYSVNSFSVVFDKYGIPYVNYYYSTPNGGQPYSNMVKLVANKWIPFGSGNQAFNPVPVEFLVDPVKNHIYSIKKDGQYSFSYGTLSVYYQDSDIKLPSIDFTTIAPKIRTDAAFQLKAATDVTVPVYFYTQNPNLITVNGSTASITKLPDVLDSAVIYASVNATRKNYFNSVNQKVKVYPSSALIPSIASVQPSSGAAGTKIKIAGRNLAQATSVKFNGVPAEFTYSTDPLLRTTADGYLVVTVPEDATTGKIVIKTPYEVVESEFKFEIPDSPITGIDISENIELKVWSSEKKIYLKIRSAEAQIEITDLNGKIIMTGQTASPNTTIPMYNNPEGIYLVKVATRERVYMSKVMYQ